MQEIEAIMGGGRIFDTGLFFTRLRYTCSRLQSMKLNQKITKCMPRRHSIRSWGLKRGEGVAQRERIFRNLQYIQVTKKFSE